MPARQLVRIVESGAEALRLEIFVKVGERPDVVWVVEDQVFDRLMDARLDETRRAELTLELELIDDRVEALRVRVLDELVVRHLTRERREVARLRDRRAVRVQDRVA